MDTTDLYTVKKELSSSDSSAKGNRGVTVCVKLITCDLDLSLLPGSLLIPLFSVGYCLDMLRIFQIYLFFFMVVAWISFGH